GIANAADLMFSARKISALEAAQMGLVNRVIPFDRFEVEVMEYARMLATEVSPRSVREMKRELWNAQFQGLNDAIESANADIPASFVSEDFKEGVAHFVEKRTPGRQSLVALVGGDRQPQRRRGHPVCRSLVVAERRQRTLVQGQIVRRHRGYRGDTVRSAGQERRGRPFSGRPRVGGEQVPHA